MSNTKLVVLVITAVLVVCLVGAGVVLMIGGSFQSLFAGGTEVIIEEAQALDVAGIKNINVHCVSGEIIIAAGAPRAELNGKIRTSQIKDNYLDVEKIGDTLSIRFDAGSTFPGFLSGNVTMRIWLPEELAAHIDVQGTSASINAQGLRFGNAKLKSVSGSVSLENCAGQTLEAETVSGAVSISGADFSDVWLRSISGAVSARRLTGDLQLKSTSGALLIEQVAGEVKADNTSGSVAVLQPQQELMPISIETISGSVELKLHPKAAFDLNLRTTSGGISTDFELLVSGSLKSSVIGRDTQGSVNGGGPEVGIKTISGGIRVMHQ